MIITEHVPIDYNNFLQLGILAEAFPPSRARSLAFATFSAGAPLGGAVGLVLGSVLVQFAPCVPRK